MGDNMKSFTKHLWFDTTNRIEFLNITNEIQKQIADSGIKEGLCLVNAMHITAAVYINDAESGLINDYQEWLKQLVPGKPEDYKHNLTGEDNAYAHLMRTVMGREVVCAVTDGKLDFGPWEQIYYADFDGQRKKRVMCKIIGE
jgi:secondary thiamine-phosphate synthase enzyme